MSKKPFDLVALMNAVFEPKPGEKLAVLIDTPHEAISDNEGWQGRRAMAEEWRLGSVGAGFDPLPLISYPATGTNNGLLPEQVLCDGQMVDLEELLSGADVAMAFASFSATAPMVTLANKLGTLRVASMPGVLRRMEKTALAADYREVNRLATLLAERLDAAESARICFDTGHECRFDLRWRHAHADGGYLPPGAKRPLINLPSGEAYSTPYEGEREGEPSKTEGKIPVAVDGGIAVLHVRENAIAEVQGAFSGAKKMRSFFEVDPARRNIAELGLGCNASAVVAGVVLEDEKAGLHWAYGRSEHLGGTVSPESFIAPENVVHRDIVYADGCAISISTLTLTYPDGTTEVLMRDNKYTV